MTNVLDLLTQHRKNAPRKPAQDGECEVIIFPGVRRERCENSFEYPTRASGTERSV